MPYRRLNILVVEDDAFQRKTIIEMLHTLGLRSTREAANGREALAIIHDKNIKIDLVLSDLKMPEMDGMAFLRHLGEEQHNLEVLIISGVDKKLLTAVAKVSSLYNIKLLDTLEKPIDLQQLKASLIKSGNTPFLPPKASHDDKQTFSLEDILEGVKQKQFKPFLQPKVDLKTGQIIGAEALARWIHPEHGIVGPYAFIPTLEQSKQIDELTFQILKASAVACKSLIDHNHPINIAVNLSLVSLDDTSMAEKITDIVTSAGISPQHITLEITESAAMTEAPYALENLARLYMEGFTLSIDDYGTGYSNLQQLTRIAFGELKIDQSFVKGFAENEAMLVVVASSIDMAHKLKIKSVAEGIETEEDWKLLRKMDCDIGQGFLIAKPMSIKHFYAFIESYRADPIAVAPKVVHEYNSKKVKANEEYKILLIEDDSFTRRISMEVLYGLGYTQAQAASSAQAAMDLFETHAFDLIITDIFMPDITGLDLIKRIRTGKTLAKPNTRIIVISSLTQSNVLGAAFALDVSGFIVKPLIPDAINKKIMLALSEPLHTHPRIAYESVEININLIEKNETTHQPPQNAKVAANVEDYYVAMHALEVGMMIKKPIYYNSGELLLDTGVVLTDELIDHLIAVHTKIKTKDFLISKPQA